jgi:hypothetical protein
MFCLVHSSMAVRCAGRGLLVAGTMEGLPDVDY